MARVIVKDTYSCAWRECVRPVGEAVPRPRRGSERRHHCNPLDATLPLARHPAQPLIWLLMARDIHNTLKIYRFAMQRWLNIVVLVSSSVAQFLTWAYHGPQYVVFKKAASWKHFELLVSKPLISKYTSVVRGCHRSCLNDYFSSIK